MSRYTKPLIALVLGFVPFFLFIGSASTLVVNGETVSDSRFNLGGIILALIGLGLAWKVIADRRKKEAGPKVLAGVAALICVLQLASSSDLMQIEPMDWIITDRNLPAAQYTGLKPDDRIYLLPESEENYRRTMTYNKAQIIAEARRHNEYATLCHGGRSRIDLARAEKIPDLFDADHLSATEAELTRRTASLDPLTCSERNSIRYMVAVPDETNREMDLYDRLIKDYDAFKAAAQ